MLSNTTYSKQTIVDIIVNQGHCSLLLLRPTKLSRNVNTVMCVHGPLQLLLAIKLCCDRDTKSLLKNDIFRNKWRGRKSQ